MEILQKIKENLWSIPLIGGIFILIALFTPMGVRFISFDRIVSYWMWGSYSSYYHGEFYTGYNASSVGSIASAICSIIIGIMSIIIISRAYKCKNSEYFRQKGFFGAALTSIIFTVIWMVLKGVGWYFQYNYVFWEEYWPSFGIIGIFIGAGITLYGHYRIKNTQNYEELRKVTASTINKKSFLFCPMCGTEIIEDNQRFCINCGHSLLP